MDLVSNILFLWGRATAYHKARCWSGSLDWQEAYEVVMHKLRGGLSLLAMTNSGLISLWREESSQKREKLEKKIEALWEAEAPVYLEEVEEHLRLSDLEVILGEIWKNGQGNKGSAVSQGQHPRAGN